MENQSSGAFKGFVAVILLLLGVCAGICTYKYVKGEIPNITQSATEEFIESEMEAVPTVEEAMQEWNDLKESSRCYEVYSNFPPFSDCFLQSLLLFLTQSEQHCNSVLPR